ncbi:MAG: CRTAC1 family protein [Acidobacteriota bacterium]
MKTRIHRGGWLLAAAALWGLGGIGCDPRSAAPDPPDAAGVEQPVTDVAASAPPASNRRMADRLLAIRRASKPMANPFANADRLAFLKALPAPSTEKERVRAAVMLAQEQLNVGHSAEAAEGLEEAIQAVLNNPEVHPEGLSSRLKMRLALAHLRRGEQENCVSGHNVDSCLMPIRGEGVHRQKDGSTAALEVLEPLLEENPDNYTHRWLYNLAAMTLGRYPDGVPEAWRVPPSAFESADDIGRFVDLAPALGLDTVGTAGGVAVDDFTGDGRPDVMTSAWGAAEPLRFFRQTVSAEGRLVFEERTEEAGLAGLTGGLNITHGDVNNDGHLDVLVLRGAWLRGQGRVPNSLLLGDGAGRFEDATERAGLLSFHPTQVGVFADFDRDGWLDLFIGNEGFPGDPHPLELYRNLGASGELAFENVTEQLGAIQCGPIKGAAWGDVDNDGWPDLYLSCFGGPNRLLRHRGATDGVLFEDVTDRAGVGEIVGSFATWFFDADNDGWLDLFVAGYSSYFVEARAAEVIASYFIDAPALNPSKFFRNRGDGTFEDRTATAGLDRARLVMGANFGDVDNDGWLDLYVGTGAPDFAALVPNQLFRNDGGERFLDITTSSGAGHLQKGHGIAFADLDADGDQDVLAVMGGAFEGDTYPNAVFVNPGHGRRWVTMRLVGRESDRSAFGARIRLDLETPDGPRSLFRTVGTGGSFGSSSLQQEIGLGEASAILAVEVRWPSGRVERPTAPPLDAHVELLEGEGVFRVLDLPPVPLPDAGLALHPHRH